jgi:chemotaxis protein methyltransferase CheR
VKTKTEPVNVARFREILTRRLGLHLDDGRLEVLGELLQRLLRSADVTPNELFRRLDAPGASAELRAIASQVTVPETYFFRDAAQFRALRQVVLPDRLRARANARELRVLSAGCASGEEPYSLAMMIREALIDPYWTVSIHAFDVNPVALEKAVRGRYSAWSLRETPLEVRERWFRAEGADHMLDAGIRDAVRFEEHSLAGPSAWVGAGYDVVFWRNVMMYLTPDAQRAALDRIERAIAPGGYLFLGHAETLRGLSHDFDLCHSHEAFYYRRRGAEAVVSPTSARHTEASSVSWIAAIDGAARRVQALSDEPVRDAVPEVADSPSEIVDASLARAFELLQRERFAEALAVVEALSAVSSRNPSMAILRAALFIHGGRLERAALACREILALDEHDAGAHYLLALCREGAGDQHGAFEHDQLAIQADPIFAMPRLHLGLLARRANDRESARRDLSRALVLLEQEDPTRILLFGGGFGRDALLALCRGELAACGGAA